jgi:hypothetical protein
MQVHWASLLSVRFRIRIFWQRVRATLSPASAAPSSPSTCSTTPEGALIR